MIEIIGREPKQSLELGSWYQGGKKEPVIIHMHSRVQGVRRKTLNGNRIVNGAQVRIPYPPYLSMGKSHASQYSLNKIHLRSMAIPPCVHVWMRFKDRL